MENKLDTLQKRMRAIQKWSGMTQAEFAATFDMGAQSFNNKLCSRNEFTVDEIINVATRYKEISLDWLIRGDGPMMVRDAEMEKLSIHLSGMRSSIEDLENKQNDLQNHVDGSFIAIQVYLSAITNHFGISPKVKPNK